MVFDSEIIACFKTINELTEWLDELAGPLDNTRRADPLPTVLLEPDDLPRRSLWNVISGGRK